MKKVAQFYNSFKTFQNKSNNKVMLQLQSEILKCIQKIYHNF